MNITRAITVSLFEALGFPGAEKMNNERLASRLATIMEAAEDDTDLGDETLQSHFDQVKQALEEGESIDIVAEEGADEAPKKKKAKNAKPAPAAKRSVPAPAEDDEDEEDEEVADEEAEAASDEDDSVAAKPKKKGKAPAKEKAPKPAKEKAPKAPKKEVEKDFLGNKVGSGAAAMNACLSDKPRSVDSIAKETGLENGRVSYHMSWLAKRGKTVKTDTGWKLAAKA